MATSPTLPTNMRAVTMCDWPRANRILNLLRHWSVARIGNGLASVQTVPIPKPSPTDILVRVKAVALNPTDWKHIDYLAPSRARVGCDCMGEVVAIPTSTAADANPHGLKVGDRVGAFSHGGQYTDQGAFAEYVAVDAASAWKVPDNVNDADAASLGVAAMTAMLCLNLTLGAPWADEEKHKAQAVPEEDRPTCLVYSGATTAGLLCVQMARLSGYRPITTCSPHSNELVRRYGAVDSFDYRSDDAVAKIHEKYPNTRMAVDCWATGGSTEFCANVVKQTPKDKGITPTVVTLLPSKLQVPGVKVEPVMGYTLFGKEFQMLAPIGPKFKAIPEHRAGGIRFAGLMNGLTKDGELKAPPVSVVPGGLDVVLDNLDRLRKNEVSGEKLVVLLK